MAMTHKPTNKDITESLSDKPTRDKYYRVDYTVIVVTPLVLLMTEYLKTC